MRQTSLGNGNDPARDISKTAYLADRLEYNKKMLGDKDFTKKNYSSSSWYASLALARVSSLLFSGVPAQATNIRTANRDITTLVKLIRKLLLFFPKYIRKKSRCQELFLKFRIFIKKTCLQYCKQANFSQFSLRTYALRNLLKITWLRQLHQRQRNRQPSYRSWQ